MKKINISTGEIMGKMCTGIYFTEDSLIIREMIMIKWYYISVKWVY